MREIKIDRYNSGGRLDKTVMKYLDKAPKGFVYKMLRKKNIVLNGAKTDGSQILSDGDLITLYLSEETIEKFRGTERLSDDNRQSRKSGKETDLSSMIVYEDENIIAMNKPSGLLSQKSSANDRSINDMLLHYLGKSDLFTPGISNRLDRNTSGIVLAGKNPLSVRLLNESLKLRGLTKLYLSIVKGRFPQDMVLEGFLDKDRESNKAFISSDQGTYIKTGYHILSARDRCSLLEIDLITGRSHQIRSQLSFAGHCIIGDRKYGDRNCNEMFYQRYGVTSQLLHAYKVEFHDMPGDLNYLNSRIITARVPDEFKKCALGENLCLPGDQED